MPTGFNLLIAELIHAAFLGPKGPFFSREAMEHNTLITKTLLFPDRVVFY